MPKGVYKRNINGSKNPHWKGGMMMLGGYWYILSPNHPNKTLTGYVAKHRLVMEKKMERILLPYELVHHKNHIKTDNRFENLMITDKYSHMVNHKEVYEKQKIDFKGKHFSVSTEFKKGHVVPKGNRI